MLCLLVHHTRIFLPWNVLSQTFMSMSINLTKYDPIESHFLFFIVRRYWKSVLEVGNISSIMGKVHRMLQFSTCNLHIYALMSSVMVQEDLVWPVKNWYLQCHKMIRSVYSIWVIFCDGYSLQFTVHSLPSCCSTKSIQKRKKSAVRNLFSFIVYQ
jgi:hypothetical protein